MQGLAHPGMEQPQRGPTGKHQCWLAITVQGLGKKTDFLRRGHKGQRLVTQVVQRLTHLRHILLDQVFGTHPAVAVQQRVAHVAQVVIQPLAQRTHQGPVIPVQPVLAQGCQPLGDQGKIIQTGHIVLLPVFGPGELIDGFSHGPPHRIAGGIGQFAFQLAQGVAVTGGRVPAPWGPDCTDHGHQSPPG